MHTLTFEGFVPSKKSRYRRVKGRGLYIAEQEKAAIDALLFQAMSQWRHPFPVDPARVEMVFRTEHRKADLDGKQTTILDVLQRAGVIRNDNMAHLVGISATYEGRGKSRTVIYVRGGTDP